MALPSAMSGLHDVSHVLQLNKFIPNPFEPVELDSVELKSDLTFQPEPDRIVNRDVKSLRNKEIPIVKVVWKGSPEGEATWGVDCNIRLKRILNVYLVLFRACLRCVKGVLVLLCRRYISE